MRICFLVSGNGGHLKFLFLVKIMKFVNNNLQLYVIGDRSCKAIDFAKTHNILNKVVKYSKQKNSELLEVLSFLNPHVIITTWNKILDEKIVDLYEGKIINLHYSLLPAFGGLIGIKPIEKAYEQNCQYIGATCHCVDKGVDTGKIIAQYIIRISLQTIIEKIFRGTNMIMLNSLIINFNLKINVENYNNRKYNYSPYLKLNDDIFNEEFWNKLKEL